MDQQCVTLTLDPTWRARLRRQPVDYVPGGTGVNYLTASIPSGIFVTMDGMLMSPSAHGETPDAFSRKTVALVTTGGAVKNPIVANFIPGISNVMNTGDMPLGANDRFSVEFPTTGDVRAQIDSLKATRTKQSCGVLFETSKQVFGGFYATKKIAREILTELAYRITRDATDPRVYAAMTALSNVAHEFTTDFAGGLQTLNRWREHQHNPAFPVVQQAVVADLLSSQATSPNIKNIIHSCAALLGSVDFTTTGVYLSSTFANPAQRNVYEVVTKNTDGCSETGMIFTAMVKRYQGF